MPALPKLTGGLPGALPGSKDGTAAITFQAPGMVKWAQVGAAGGPEGR